MNKMKIFNLVYKIKNPITEKSYAVDRLKMRYIKIKKRFIKSLPSCKYVNPLGWSYVHTRSKMSASSSGSDQIHDSICFIVSYSDVSIYLHTV